jgi:hypothetical protein
MLTNIALHQGTRDKEEKNNKHYNLNGVCEIEASLSMT